ncbi:nucleotide sugar dehydrogenase [Halogeometricum luteum]|uniref:UDP-N-acetyl-D-mannosamine dehydrogenase n=1 Tax=Halogeometricum luteum TaxID=2950537 RepID=A0ABU2G4N2_9EURY|nr:nucleotide sugar dehydrogenase [Halogeometricum sp. S3BR5-2]MDS0295243.1 nucleotide sugar dehydrogenase [Halogeometricum sp. S3BR5-2]
MNPNSEDTTRTIESLYHASVSPVRQSEALTTGEVPVAVYGLGKMGLPIAASFAALTGNVTGVDIDPDVVERINDGVSPVRGEPGLADAVERTVADGSLSASTDAADAASEASVHVVIVPTVIREDGSPDLTALEQVVPAIGTGLDPGDVVLIESTVPPGTCSEVVRPTLEAESGLSLGEFGLAFCPERTASGTALSDIRGTYPKVVGGADAESTRVASLVYGELTENAVVPVSDATTAECVKVFEGVYRDVNIALANEIARASGELGIDTLEAIDAANTLSVCDIHRPGPGVGGHCIPYYPRFLLSRAPDARLVRTAREVNESMPAFTVEKLREQLREAGGEVADARVLVLGVTYRPGVEETRESPAYPIAAELDDAGATVFAADPMLDEMPGLRATPASIDELTSLDLDAVVVVTPHEEFDRIEWSAFDDLVVVDGRDAYDLDGTTHRVYTLGRY